MRLRCPSDKSLTHRAVIFSSLANGKSTIVDPLLGEDCLSTLNAFKLMGVEVSEGVEDKRPSLKIKSPGWDELANPKSPIDFGNSGTTARLLLGLFSATEGMEFQCFGDESLSQRPMGRVCESLRSIGADIKYDGRDGFLPIHLHGRKLESFALNSDKASAQVKSAWILAALNCEGWSEISLPKGSRNHTELILARLGAEINVQQNSAGLEKIRIRGPFRPGAHSWRIPADPSSVAFFAVLRALHPRTQLILTECLDNPTRNGFLTKMKEAGFSIQREKPLEDFAHDFLEPVFDLSVVDKGSSHTAFSITPDEIPSLIDEVPILGVLAAFCVGESKFNGLAELRVKESDRLSQLSLLLNKAGIHSEIGDDWIVIQGLGPAAVLKSFEFDSQGDHRLAMTAAILATRTDDIKACRIKNKQAVNVSFPDFFKILRNIGFSVE